MKKALLLITLSIALILASCAGAAPGESSAPVEDSETVSLPQEKVSHYTDAQMEDKLLGGWVGQMAGVVYGAKSEFQYWGTIMPEEDVPDFSTLNINDAF
ncbi:MAG: hypothetical protein IKV50_00480, partial [Clostridia bacterium]|nr:hypothetical protein [Clostridia bacterium]